jgi:hypothetical protein
LLKSSFACHEAKTDNYDVALLRCQHLSENIFEPRSGCSRIPSWPPVEEARILRPLTERSSTFSNQFLRRSEARIGANQKPIMALKVNRFVTGLNQRGAHYTHRFFRVNNKFEIHIQT